MHQTPNFPLKDEAKYHKWDAVYVFISSTFNDMHAERDFLVKRVFPEVSEWCERRQLRLVDIDLRWGVSEADAAENKKVVQVCLERIDDCRPFFLCFLGQRRGWIPDYENDISLETKKAFERLAAYRGNSVTEMEITHARIDPLHNGKLFDANQNPRDGSAVKYAFFFLRDDDYLKQAAYTRHEENRELGYIYTNASPDELIPDKQEKAIAYKEATDQKLRTWREEKIPEAAKGKGNEKDRPVIHYAAEWIPRGQTPEIAWPKTVPTFSPQGSDLWRKSFDRWQAQWRRAGVTVDTDGTITGQELAKADAFIGRLTAGRLGNFLCDEGSLEKTIVKELEEAITLRFVTHEEIAIKTPLQKELLEQAKYLQITAEGYIPIGNMFDKIDSYMENGGSSLVISAKSGMGKSCLIASYIKESKYDIIYRFAGISDQSHTPERLTRSILDELKTDGRFAGDIPENDIELLQRFPSLLEESAQHKPLIVVIDALDQLVGGFKQINYIPRSLSKNLRFICSFQSDADGAAHFGREVEKFTQPCPITEFEADDKVQLIKSYFNKYFKELDNVLLQHLIGLKGSNNPLYLKIILNELRVFGSYDNLKQKVNNEHNAYGIEPVNAFQEVLQRLESDANYYNVDAQRFITHVFSWIAHSRNGLSVDELCNLLYDNHIVTGDEAEAKTIAKDTVNSLYQQLRNYLVKRDGRINFFFSSFKRATQNRYCQSRNSSEWHRDLVTYFRKKDADPLRRLNELAYQLANANMRDEYDALLSDFSHHEAQIKYFGLSAIIEDCSFLPHEGSDILHKFYLLASTTLSQHPEQLASELWGRIHKQNHRICSALLDDAAGQMKKRGVSWLRPKFPCLDSPDDAVLLRLHTDHEMNDSFALSDDQKTMYIASRSAQILSVWDLELGQKVLQKKIDKGYPELIKLSPDGRLLAVSLNHDIGIFNVITLEEIQRYESLIPYHANRPGYVMPGNFAFTPDSRHVVVYSKQTIVLHDIHTGERISSVDYKHQPVSYSFGGNLLATGNLHPDVTHNEWNAPWFNKAFCPIHLFDYKSENQTLQPRGFSLEGHKGTVRVIAVSADEKYILSAGEGGNLRLWNAVDGKLLHEINLDRNGIKALQFFRGDKMAMVAGGNGILRLFSIPDFQFMGEIPCRFGYIASAKLLADMKRCVVTSEDLTHEIKIMSLENPKKEKNFSVQINRIAKNDTQNLWIASSYWDVLNIQGHVPVQGEEKKGDICFFDADNNMLLNAKPLLGTRQEDFVYLDPVGEWVVSKDCLYDSGNIATIRHWPLEQFPTLQGDLVGTMFSIKSSDETRYYSEFNPTLIGFSARFDYVIHRNDRQSILDVYRTKSGRFIASLPFKTRTSDKENMHDCVFDANVDGSIIYVFNSYSGILRIYKISRGRGKLKKRIKLKNHILRFGHSVYDESVGLSLCYNDKYLLYQSPNAVSVLDLKKKTVIFQLNRNKHKPGEESSDDDCHATLSNNGQLLCLSRKIWQAEGVSTQKCVEVWDITTQTVVARFFTDGHISNIISEYRNFTFGTGSGKLCTLTLENNEQLY